MEVKVAESYQFHSVTNESGTLKLSYVYWLPLGVYSPSLMIILDHFTNMRSIFDSSRLPIESVMGKHMIPDFNRA
ncbi:hypothetical protein BDQ12DRAFT_684187 [Crucibulum laeve]|uniref:Uncharacterized protein n=1 Tax=Crucibulum laeve TaxID=68775 RepID=A0A5C3M0B7_9AGAR|nr:hypothetical protein BDQ12DRAFT_684187 [Crucibulum laeve]